MKTRLLVSFTALIATVLSLGVVATAGAAPARSRQTGKTTVLRGKIDKQSITMNLTRTGSQITGTYRYTRIGKDIPVNGTVDGEGKLTLQEFGAGGSRPTGFFKGTWEDTDENPGISIYGDWSKTANAPNPLNFYATEDVIDSSLRIESVPIAQTLRRPRLTVDASYPQIVGSTNPNAAKFNQLMKTEITKMIADMKKEISGNTDIPAGLRNGNSFDAGYTVMYANDDLISVIFDISPYYEGAAHPSHNNQVYNYDLKRGRLWGLGDLFKPATYWLDYISRLCIENLTARLKPEGQDGMGSDPEWIRTGAGPNPDNFANWNITRKGVLITFPPYQVASYADGPKYVLIPYEKIQNLRAPDGPIAGF